MILTTDNVFAVVLNLFFVFLVVEVRPNRAEMWLECRFFLTAR